MYNVSKGPSKLVTQTRRGISQHLERLENRRDSTRRPNDHLALPESASVPRPVFHNNGHMRRNHQNGMHRRRDTISPQHAEIIQFIHDSWTNIYMQYEQYSPVSSPGSNCSTNSTELIVYYKSEPTGVLENFKPFDLESWWSKQLYNQLTTSI